MGKDKSAGSRAAGEANKLTQQGIDALMPFLTAGAGQLGSLTQGATAGGLNERLAEILGGDTFSALTGERERAVQGQLSAGGLTRSGTGLQSIANVPTELALQLESLLTGRSQQLAGQGLGAGTNIASLFNLQGENVSSGIVTDASASASALGQIGQFASGIFFSDPRLKTNVVEIGDIDGLPIVQWDWEEFTKGTIIADCPTVGFMADAVEKLYPDCVGEFGGWKSIDYELLKSHLQANLNHKIQAEAA